MPPCLPHFKPHETHQTASFIYARPETQCCFRSSNTVYSLQLRRQNVVIFSPNWSSLVLHFATSDHNEVSIAPCTRRRLLLPLRATLTRVYAGNRKWNMGGFAAAPNFDHIFHLALPSEWLSALPTVFGGLSIGSADLIWPIYHICFRPGPAQIEKRGISEFLLN